MFDTCSPLYHTRSGRLLFNGRAILCLSLAIVLLGTIIWPLEWPDARAESTQAGARIIVKLRPDPGGAVDPDALLALPGVQSVAPLSRPAGGRFARPAIKEAIGLARIYVLTLSPGAEVTETLRALSTDPAIEYAEPDRVGYAAGLPNDQWFAYQWNFHNTGQSGGTPDADVDAPEAWDISRGVTTTVIAVIDTGVDLDHPDLAAKLVAGYDFVNGDEAPQDDHGHGTHVAGIAAALTDNGIGAAGMCPECRIMPLKALNSANWGYYSWWASAIEYAVDHGAAVINMSMGGSDPSQLLKDAIRYAYAADVPVVAAMMNDGNATPYYPAVFTETIAVGATDRYDRRWNSSNYGTHIDLVAPGAEILSAKWNDTYAIWNGTSMATPHVAGVLGLIRALRPGFTVEQLRAALRATAQDQVGPANEDKKGWDQYFGAGRLNAEQALRYVIPAATLSVSGPASGRPGENYTFIAAVGPITAARPITFTWRASGLAPIVHVSNGLTDSVTLAWSTEGVQTITATAMNFGGAVSTTHEVTIALPPAGELTVCAEGGCDHASLQSAVDAISAGGVIRLAAGVYTGVNSYGGLAQVVYVNKNVTIRGGYTMDFSEPPDPASNSTTIDARGGGRGLYVASGVSLTLEGVSVTGGNAAGLGGGTGGGDAGGGLYALNAQLSIRNCRFYGNTARWGGGLNLVGGSAVFASNVFTANTARWGGGLYLKDGCATLDDNLISTNSAEKDGGGAYLDGNVTRLNRNRLLANTAGEWGGGIYLSGGALEMVNNVVADNRAASAGGGLYVRTASPRLVHTTFARNGMSGVHIAAGSAWLTNTILVGHTTGILVTTGNSAALEATLWGNESDWGGGGTVSAGEWNYWGDPAFADPTAGDYHIRPTSAALDAGVEAGVSDDLDGNVRPLSVRPDLGADESPIALQVEQRVNPGLAWAGMPLTYTLRVTNSGVVTLHAAITDILPAHVTPGGTRAWTLLLTPGAVWTGTVTVAVETGYAGALTNTVQVETVEGAAHKSVSVITAVAAGQMATVGPEGGGMVIVGADGLTVTIDVPPGAVDAPTQLAYTRLPEVSGAPIGLHFAGRAFNLEAYSDGAHAVGLTFHKPVTVTIYYSAGDVAGLDEETLELRYWAGDEWRSDGIAIVARDVPLRRLTATITHLTPFATFGREPHPPAPVYRVYLPLVRRS